MARKLFKTPIDPKRLRNNPNECPSRNPHQDCKNSGMMVDIEQLITHYTTKRIAVVIIV